MRYRFQFKTLCLAAGMLWAIPPGGRGQAVRAPARAVNPFAMDAATVLDLRFDEGPGAMDYTRWSVATTPMRVTWTNLPGIGGAYDFGGVNSYISLGNPPHLNFGATGSYSFVFHMRKEGAYKNYDQVISKGVTGNQRIHFLIDATGRLIRWDAFTGPVIPIGQWIHVVYVYQAAGSNTGTERFYTDGVLTHTRTGTMATWSAANDYWMGWHTHMGGSWPFRGLWARFSMFDRALDPDEVRLLYELSRRPGR